MRKTRALVTGGAGFLGSRFLHQAPKGYRANRIANKFLTSLSNAFTHLHLTDMETCYKIFKREIIQAVDIEENRFGFEPEITAKIAKTNVRVKEVPISYFPRTNEDGKKIGFRDGLRAIYCIWKYRRGSMKQFLTYFSVGGVSALVEWTLFALLLYLLDMSYPVATTLAFVTVSTTTNWYLGRTFTFKYSEAYEGKSVNKFQWIVVIRENRKQGWNQKRILK